MNLDYIQVPLMLKAYLVEGLSVNAGVQVGFLCGDGKVKREETDLQKDKNGSITYKDMQETEAPWPAKKVDVAIPLGLSYGIYERDSGCPLQREPDEGWQG